MNFYTRPSDVYISEPTGRLNMSRINFPYTPTLTIMSQSGYSSYAMTHSNFQQYAFNISNNTMFQLVVPIVVRDVEEIDTIVSMADFFRAALKMGFGQKDEALGEAGKPPPVLRLNAYGIYKNVPVLLQDFTWNLESEVDYLSNPSGTVKIPVTSSFAFGLQTTYGADKVRKEFSLREFAAGGLRNEGYV